MTQRAVTQMKRIFARTKKRGGRGRTCSPPSTPSPGATGCFPLFLSSPRALLSAWKCATCSKSFRERLKFVGRSSGLAAPLHSVVTSMVEQACKRGEDVAGDTISRIPRSHRLPGYRLWLLTPRDLIESWR